MKFHSVLEPFRIARFVPLLALFLAASPLRAGFAGTDVVIPAVARADGQQGARFYSTLWLTNSAASPITYQMKFYENGASNTSPASVSGTLAAGETLRFDDVVGNTFNLSGKSGALRITSSGEILASSRTYSLAAGSTLDSSVGLFFGAIPVGFSIGAGETAQLQGVSQNASENFRYNFGYVETQGAAARVQFTARGSGNEVLGTLAVDAAAYERRQFSASDIAASLATSNGRIEATVLSGTGKVLVYGTQIANGSNDSSGFEMSFRSSLLSGAAGGVTTLNGLAGALTLVAGPNVTITPFGSTLTIGTSGSAGGLNLPFQGVTSQNGEVFSATNSGTGDGIAGVAAVGKGVSGTGGSAGVYGTTSALGNAAGVVGIATATTGTPAGVYGESQSISGIGVWGRGRATTGIPIGVLGQADAPDGRGVQGTSTTGGDAMYALAASTQASGIALHALTAGKQAGASSLDFDDRNSAAVFAEAVNTADSVYGVVGKVSSGSPYAAGIFGESLGTFSAAGVFRHKSPASNTLTTLAFQQGTHKYGIQTFDEGFFGILTATTKAFVQPHPEDATKEIEYISVEAPTSDVYFRGTARVVNGVARVEVPEHFRLVARAGSYMTTVTAVGSQGATLSVESEDETGIVVRAPRDVTFHYVVYAERALFPGHQAIVANEHFRPELLQKGQALDAMPESMKLLLVRNGTLNPDHSFNEATARRAGWKLMPAPPAAEGEVPVGR